MRRLLPLLLLLGCARPSAPAEFTAEHRAAIVDSVTTMVNAWRRAVSSRDANLVGAFYSREQGFRWIEDGAVRYTSAQQVSDAYHALIPSVRTMELTLDNPAVTPLAPGAALVTTVFTQKVTDTTGSVTGFAGMLSMTVVHGDSGWQFLAGHTSSVPHEGKPPVQKSN